MPNHKLLIGLLASHDHPDPNNKLARLLEKLCKPGREDLLEKFHFLITGGTYRRIISKQEDLNGVQPVNEQLIHTLEPHMTVLPSRNHGGVTVLAHFITQQKCKIIWPFLTPLTSHWLTPENLALFRLCDQWKVKRLMNTGSVEGWLKKEASKEADDIYQNCPPEIVFYRRGKEGREKEDVISAHKEGAHYQFQDPPPIGPGSSLKVEEMTLAMIAHDGMKAQMAKFANQYKSKLGRFRRVLATGTTGLEIEEAAPSLANKIYRYHSGPKGGDIEIATEILYGKCQVVIFFIDPLQPHPHIEDIRVVLAACMIQDHVRMLTNEVQATAWIERIAGPRRPLNAAAARAGH